MKDGKWKVGWDAGLRARRGGAQSLDGLYEPLGWRSFDKEGGGAGGEGPGSIIGVEGEKNHVDLGVPALDATGGLQTIHHRHAYIHDHDIGVVLVDQAYGLLAVGRLGDDLDVVAGGEQCAQPLAGAQTIVDDEYTDGVCHCFFALIESVCAN